MRRTALVGGMALLSGGLAVGWAACAVYNFFEGEGLPWDVVDEWRLRRADLRTLDRAWKANPRRSDIVVCLTTIPSRLPALGETLKSLLRQRLAPAEIRLHLPHKSRREGVDYDVPPWLAELEAVRIVRCEDHGPATKLLPALELPASTRLLVVDDDKIYDETLVEILDEASRATPDAALTLSGWVVPHDLVDRPTTILSNVFRRPPAPICARRLRQPIEIDVLQGTSGYLVRPSFFDRDKILDYTSAPKAAFYVDDVWISGHCRARKFVVPARRSAFVPWSRRDAIKQSSLGLINRGDGRPENRNNTIAIRHLSESWLCRRA